MPRELDLSKLSQFEPRQERTSRPERSLPKAERDMPAPQADDRAWPSREPMLDGQISIKAPQQLLGRFKKLCKDDRRTYADMLEILMDAFESKAR